MENVNHSNNRPILYIDMDGVICDFKKSAEEYKQKHPEYSGEEDCIPRLFSVDMMYPIEGAIEAVKKLVSKYDMYILTTAPWGNESALQDKKDWISHYFGEMFKKRIIFTHRKDLCIGDYLIDDNPYNTTAAFKGKILSFGRSISGKINEYPTWDDILKQLL